MSGKVISFFNESLMGRSRDTHLSEVTIFLGTTEIKYQNIPSTASVGTANSNSQNQDDSESIFPGVARAAPLHTHHVQDTETLKCH